jgi:hypothetical protein
MQALNAGGQCRAAATGVVYSADSQLQHLAVLGYCRATDKQYYHRVLPGSDGCAVVAVRTLTGQAATETVAEQLHECPACREKPNACVCWSDEFMTR